MKKCMVRLEAEERAQLEQIVRVGKRVAYVVRHANILLAVDESEGGRQMTDEQAAYAFFGSFDRASASTAGGRWSGSGLGAQEASAAQRRKDF